MPLHSNVRFTCSSPSDSPTSIEWFKNGTRLDDMDKGVNITFCLGLVGTLILNSSSVNCAIIHCEATFDSGESNASVKVPLCTHVQGLLASAIG